MLCECGWVYMFVGGVDMLWRACVGVCACVCCVGCGGCREQLFCVG